MRRALATTFLILLLAVAPGLACRAEIAAPAVADRVPNLGPAPGKTLAAGDTGLYSMHLSLDGKTLWLGRARGVRKIDLATGAWKFMASTQCSGGNIISMADTGDALWALTAPEGRICRLEYATSHWSRPGNWKMREYVAGATRLVYDAATRRLYVNGQGGPDTEGIALIDPVRIQWLRLFKTKPVYDFKVSGNTIFAATWDGLVIIDTSTRKYKYMVHSMHGCGAEVTDLIEQSCYSDAMCAFWTKMPVIIATKPVRHTELGHAMKVFKDGVGVLASPPGKPYSFRWRYYRRDESKRLNADYFRLFQTRDMDTPGGLCWSRDGDTWGGLYKKDGLPGNTVMKLADGGTVYYAATESGLAVINKLNWKVIKTLPDIRRVIELIAVPHQGLWIAAEGGPVYFVKKEKLTGTPPAKPAK